MCRHICDVTEVLSVPKVVNHELKKEEVARATWRVVARLGLEAATIREIAKEARCSTGALTHYFKNKDELLLYALGLSVEREAGRMIEKRLETSGYEALRGVLLEALPLDRERRLEWQVWVNFWSRRARKASVANEQKRWYGQYRNGVRDLLLYCQQMGILRSDIDPSREADAISVFVDGIGVNATLNPQRFPSKLQVAMLDHYLENLFRR